MWRSIKCDADHCFDCLMFASASIFHWLVELRKLGVDCDLWVWRSVTRRAVVVGPSRGGGGLGGVLSGGGRLLGGEGGGSVVVDVLEARLSSGMGRSRSTVHLHPDWSAGQGRRVAATPAPPPGSLPVSWPGPCGQAVAESVLQGGGCVLLCRIWTVVGVASISVVSGRDAEISVAG